MKRKTKQSIVKDILLTDIDIHPETLSRKSLADCLKGNAKNWLSAIEKKENIQFQDLQELMASMKKSGQIEVIVVNEIEVPKILLDEDDREGVYILVCGLRRFLAAYFLGWKRIRAVIR